MGPETGSATGGAETGRFSSELPNHSNTPKEQYDQYDSKDHIIKVYDTGRYGTLKYPKLPCGHKFKGDEPKHKGCEQCWFMFFQAYGALTQSVEELYQKHGEAGVVQLRGRAFYNNWKKFMAAVAQMSAQIAAAKEQNEFSTGSIESSQEPGFGAYDDEDPNAGIDPGSVVSSEQGGQVQAVEGSGSVTEQTVFDYE